MAHLVKILYDIFIFLDTEENSVTIMYEIYTFLGHFYCNHYHCQNEPRLNSETFSHFVTLKSTGNRNLLYLSAIGCLE